MEDKAPRIATGQPDASNQEQREGSFSLWDALDLAFVENHPRYTLKSFTDSFSSLDTETVENYPPDMLKALTDSFSSLDTERQTRLLRLIGEIGGRLPDGPKKGVLSYFLAKHLDDPSEEVRFVATQAVGILTRQAFTTALAAKMVSDESIRVRVASAEALGELSASVTLQALKASLSDPSWKVRAAAIQAIGKLSERLILEPLKIALDDEDFSVRSAALHALGTLKGCLPTGYLVLMAQEETNDWITREAAVTALERAGESALAKLFREKLDHELEMERSMTEEELLAFPDPEEDQRCSNGSLPAASSIPEEQGGRKEQEKLEIHIQKEGDVNREHTISLKDGETGNAKTAQASKREHHKGGKGQRYHFPGWGKDTKNKDVRKRQCGEKAVASNLFYRSRGMLLLLIILSMVAVGSIMHSYANDIRTDAFFRTFSTVPSQSTVMLDVAWQSQDDAHLEIVSQPGSVRSRQSFSVSIIATNTGLTTWTSTGDYELTCSSDDQQGENCMGLNGVFIGHTVSHGGGTYTFIVPFRAPLDPGTYTLWWTMAHDGTSFGNKICIKVRVS
ncbi:MAG TPA: HEAT repeat domain-containing protein [Ktedonobacteraceae bacterium]|nr:HEAT repeat domain-containing protein [Ktedonobacteraceae bacterium]